MQDWQTGERNRRSAQNTGHHLLIAALGKFLKGPVPHDKPRQPESGEGRKGKEKTGS